MTDINKVLFLHIPKTAGSSLISSEIGSKIDCRIHSFVGSLEDKILEHGATKHFKFCITRNPWDRFSSLYHYFYHMKEDHMFFKFNPSIIKLVRRYDSFEKFCLAFPELQVKNFHFYPQSRYMLIDGRNIIDFSCKVEDLSTDIHQLAEALNITLTKEFPHSNKSASIDYRELYSTKMKDVVAQCYSIDVESLGYKF
jgi:hypothetical protein